MNDLFGGHHFTGSPVEIINRSGLSPAVALSPKRSGTAHQSGIAAGGREASPWYCRLVKTTMQQMSVQELIAEGLDQKTLLRAVLELAAQEIEKQSGNPMYAAAFKKSAAKVRSLKPD
jgi:hypothetical protein